MSLAATATVLAGLAAVASATPTHTQEQVSYRAAHSASGRHRFFSALDSSFPCFRIRTCIGSCTCARLFCFARFMIDDA
jgi:hypothetical protein